MDFSVFPCRKKKKPAPPPPPPAPAPPPPPPPPPPKPPSLPEFMQQIPRVPGSRNVEMLFRWNMDHPSMGGGYPDMRGGYHPGYAYGPFDAPMHRNMAFPGPHLLGGGGGGMHGAMQPFGQPFGHGRQPFGQPFGQGMHPHGPHPYNQGMDPFGGAMHPFGQVHMDCGFDPCGHGMHPRHFGHF